MYEWLQSYSYRVGVHSAGCSLLLVLRRFLLLFSRLALIDQSGSRKPGKKFNKKISEKEMFKNYLKTAWRNLLRYKLFSGLNILGLATGMACSILIFLWVQDELSFDKFNHNADASFQGY